MRLSNLNQLKRLARALRELEAADSQVIGTERCEFHIATKLQKAGCQLCYRHKLAGRDWVKWKRIRVDPGFFTVAAGPIFQKAFDVAAGWIHLSTERIYILSPLLDSIDLLARPDVESLIGPWEAFVTKEIQRLSKPLRHSNVPE